MANNKVRYENPLISRYASNEMAQIFSPDSKFKTWRKLWIALAEAEKELGLNIKQEQIDELVQNMDNINYDIAEIKEKEFRHDVMAHIHAYGTQCPNAMPIIHLGATSAYVGDNTDIILSKKALRLIKVKLVNLMSNIKIFALKYKDVPTLGFTHFQPAQLTTVGKRATLWLHDLYMDYNELEHLMDNLKMRGAKGTTGTQASFLELFNNNHEKVKKLDKLIAKKMGFKQTYPVTGQTCSRKIDANIVYLLSQIAQSLHKMTNDIRLLQHLKEIEEPFEKKQIGSSAMAYKRNPMRSERVSSLSKYIMSNVVSTMMVSSTQWLERTLDDSANKRIVIPQTFLACDAILEICINISSGIKVYKNVIDSHIKNEIPFMATENILMEAVKKGGNRQELHEIIRELSMEAAKQVKEYGNENDLLKRIVECDKFNITKEELQNIVEPKKFIGRAPQQVEEFVEQYINPILIKNKNILGIKVNLKV